MTIDNSGIKFAIENNHSFQKGSVMVQLWFSKSSHDLMIQKQVFLKYIELRGWVSPQNAKINMAFLTTYSSYYLQQTN